MVKRQFTQRKSVSEKSPSRDDLDSISADLIARQQVHQKKRRAEALTPKSRANTSVWTLHSAKRLEGHK